jgi:hypothetical protein
MIEKDLIVYLLKECEGLHTFHISRILALLDMEYIKNTGKKLTSLDYQKTEYGFTSDKLAQIMKELPVEKVKAKPYGYMVLKEDLPVNLPEDVLKTLNKLLDEICDLSDTELNMRVLKSPYYEKL